MTIRSADATTVVFCGLATLDLLQTLDRLPSPDEKVVARDLQVAAGGPATNAAVTAAALGVRAVLVTRIGTGPLADAVRADLREHHVEVLDLAEDGYAPAVSTVLVTAGTGQRAVVSVNAAGSGTRPGGPDARHLAGPPQVAGPAEPWATEILAGASVLLVDGHHLDLAVPLAQAARRAATPVLLDGGSWKPGLEELLRRVDVAVVSADLRIPEALAESGAAATTPPASGRATDAGHSPDQDALAALAALGPSVVARSHGDAPIEVLTTTAHPPWRGDVAVPVVDVVDTLGAGDVLHGALAAWWAHHPGATTSSGPLTWQRALEAAAAVASSSCSGVGARGWLREADGVAAARARVGAPPVLR